MSIPTSIVVGDTFVASVPGASTIRLRGADMKTLPLTNGECAVSTNNWTPGTYKVFVTTTDASTTTTTQFPNLEVVDLDDIDETNVLDTFEAIIKLIDDTIAGKVSKDVLSQQLNDRQITRYGLAELFALRKEYASLHNTQKAKLEGRSNGFQIIGTRL